MVQDIIKCNNKEFQLSTIYIKNMDIFETMIFPIENGTISGNEVYCFRTPDSGESKDKHEDIYYHPRKYVSEEAINDYLSKKNADDLQQTENSAVHNQRKMYNPCFECLNRYGHSYTSDCDNTCQYANALSKLKQFGGLDEVLKVMNGDAFPVVLIDNDHIENTFRIVSAAKDKVI